jgi:hypothetical protein
MHAEWLLIAQYVACFLMLVWIWGLQGTARTFGSAADRQHANQLTSALFVLGVGFLGPFGSADRYLFPIDAALLAGFVFLDLAANARARTSTGLLVQALLLMLALTIAIGRFLII